MMSAAQSTSRLESLECHFTWNVDASRSTLFQIRDVLVDIGTEEGNSWLGHIYNLQGFLHYQLGFSEEARDFFSRATETFHQLGDADEGPWLVVNYGNLAWLHHHLGEDSESRGYLSKLDTLMEKYPPPIQDELHPEVCAEKAWTLMKFDKDQQLEAADYFQRAVRMKPDMAPWKTSRVLTLMSTYNYDEIPDVEVFEEMRKAREEDPENLFLAAVDLLQRAKRGEQVKEDADELEENILMNPVSSYNGIRALIRVYRQLECYDEAIDLVEKALKKHPDVRYLKKCTALSYRWRIIFFKGSRPNQSMMSRAISLHEEVVSLYPHSSLMKEIDLANVYAKSGNSLMRAEQMYQEIMARDLEPAEKQMVYNCYAKYLFFDQGKVLKSIQYNMQAIEIPHQSFFRQNSINTLQKISNQGSCRMCRDIREFLENLPDSEPAAAQSQSRLESLECHFTWKLDASRSKLMRIRDALVDIGTEEGNSWLGHIYNLQGFLHYQLGFSEKARDFFSRATETFHQLGDADEGPWLVVNYGNLAWLHHHLGEDSESQGYLSKLDTLMEKYPPPIQDELHPEVCAEKAWTLMTLYKDKKKKLEAADYFQRAVRMKPDVVPWKTSRVLALVNVYKYDDTPDVDILEEMRMGREEDPENLYLAAVDLLLSAKRGEQVKEEADELGEKILMNPVSSYSGMRVLIRVYRQLKCYDEAIDLAEKALKKHPDVRYLKRCAAPCYALKIWSFKDSPLSDGIIKRAISLHEEVVFLYPHSSLLKEIYLANVYAMSGNDLMRAEQMYQEMMERDLEPADKQMIYNCYARYLFINQGKVLKSIQYNMQAIEIPHQSFFRQNSINTLQKISNQGSCRMCREIREFLENLPDSEPAAAQIRSRLESLECHFTWNLDARRSTLFRLRDKLVDIGTEEGNSWLGHIYNLQGFLHYQLGFSEEARDFFSRATETFHQLGDADEGPWLVVNYGNLAWLHHHLGEDSESQGYLSKLDTLMEKYPPPIQDELHPELCAEKAWTLMKFDKEKRLQAADYFQRAVRMKPEMVPWQTSRVLALMKANIYDYNDQDVDILEEMRKAREEDPENLYLVALYMLLRAKRGEQVKKEADELREKILMNPVSSYSGIKTLMMVYWQLDCDDVVIDLAEKALKKHPEVRYLKRCASLWYRWRVIFFKGSRPSQSMISRAISLHEEVVSLYPHSSLMKKIDLANLYAKSGNGLMRAEQMYQEIMSRDLEPAEKQMVYSCYAKYLYYDRGDFQKSIQYHRKAAEIPHQSSFRRSSIKILERIRE